MNMLFLGLLFTIVYLAKQAVWQSESSWYDIRIIPIYLSLTQCQEDKF